MATPGGVAQESNDEPMTKHVYNLLHLYNRKKLTAEYHARTILKADNTLQSINPLLAVVPKTYTKASQKSEYPQPPTHRSLHTSASLA